MIINPSTTIKLYSGMPLDNTYTNTLFWSSKTNQTNFFHLDCPYYKHTANISTYQRINKGVCEVEIPADDIYDCNYMAFQNSNYGNKWFYAFITSVEYVNNANSRVYYEIDVMQTYWFEATLKECTVLREHQATDVPGDNLLAEPVGINNIICNQRIQHELSNSYRLVLVSANFDEVNVPGVTPQILPKAPIVNVVGNMFSLSDVQSFDISSLQGIQDVRKFINEMQGEYGTLISMYLYPSNLIGTKTERHVDAQERTRIYDITLPNTLSYNVARPVSFYNRDNPTQNYVPKNKKMLCYPFNYLSVDFGNMNNIYRYEHFYNTDVTPHATGQAYFKIKGVPSSTPEILLIPQYYKGSWLDTSTEKLNYDECMKFTRLPKVPFPIDSFLSWWAQNSTAMIARAGANSIRTFRDSLASSLSNPATYNEGAIASRGYGGVGMSFAIAGGKATDNLMDGLTDIGISAIAHEQETNRWIGQPESDVRFTYDGIKFEFNRMQVEYNEAKSIDDYFTRFGYTCNKLKVPSRNNRPHWTYVRTNGCNITGEFPSDDIAKMKLIYNKGITFWNFASEVGNYSLDNSPL